MNLLELNLFRLGFLKQAKYLVSTPSQSQNVIFISETGLISKEVLPMSTVYVTAQNLKMTWLVLHPLKILLRKKSGEIDENQYLLITERSFIPLDPFNKLTEEEAKNITPLSTVAKLKHAEARTNVAENNMDARNRMMQTVVTGSLIIIGMMVLAGAWRMLTGG